MMNKSTLGAPWLHFWSFFNTFWSHFGIDFSTFSEMAKTQKLVTLTTLSKAFTSKNRSFFDSFYINFSTFAPERLLEGIFRAPGADLRSKGRFLVPLRISRGAKMDLEFQLFGQKGSKRA